MNVKLGQTADITIDAIPNRTFKGSVIEIGNTAILRSTGVAASQSTVSSQEAKDFKVVVALNDSAGGHPPRTVLHRQGHHRHPEPCSQYPDPGADGSAEGRSGASRRTARLQQGSVDPVRRRRARKRFRVSSWSAGDKAEFRKVETGITGCDRH